MVSAAPKGRRPAIEQGPKRLVAVWRSKSDGPAARLSLWLAIVFLLGGSSRGDISSLILLRPLSILFLAHALYGLTRAQVRQNRILLALAAAWLALPLLQLVPLPPVLWHGLPGRQILRDIDLQAGLGPTWRPLSMAPAATWNAVWSLPAPLAVLVMGVQLDDRGRARLLLPVILLGCMSAAIGVLQLLTASSGLFDLYRIAGRGQPIGLLANRNHQAALLAMMLPMLATWAAMRTRRSLRAVSRQWWAPMAGAVFLVPLILLTGSRSGLVLAAVGLLSVPLLISGNRLSPRQAGSGRGAVVFGAGVVALVVLAIWLDRAASVDRLFALDPGADLRLRALPVIVTMIGIYAPWGSGIGTFEPVYKLHEPDALLSPSYLNHAHDDWLELLVTGGLPAALLLMLSLAALAVAIVRRWRVGRAGDGLPPLVALGALMLLMFALASLSDYPLRTPSLASLGAVAVLWVATGASRETLRTG
jgi:O-antigen ligase